MSDDIVGAAIVAVVELVLWTVMAILEAVGLTALWIGRRLYLLGERVVLGPPTQRELVRLSLEHHVARRKVAAIGARATEEIRAIGRGEVSHQQW